MTWNSIMGLVSSIALLLPVVLILLFRLATYKSFPAIFIYYCTIFAYNIARSQYFPVSPAVLEYWNTINNFLDAPLVLYFLSYFSGSVALSKKMKQLIAVLLLFQLTVVMIVGFNNKAITIFLGPSILVVFGFCLHFFVRQTKITITHQKAAGKAIITASLLFAYGCYAIIYLMYYVFKTPYVEDTFLVYFLVVTLSSLLMGVGIIAERKRIQKLTELLQTRKELSVIYKNESQPVRSIRTVALDFDKDPWV
jgi:hypothetical protein